MFLFPREYNSDLKLRTNSILTGGPGQCSGVAHGTSPDMILAESQMVSVLGHLSCRQKVILLRAAVFRPPRPT